MKEQHTSSSGIRGRRASSSSSSVDAAQLPAGLGFSRLSNEPRRLKAEAERLKQAVQQLSVEEYDVHIQHHAAIGVVRSGVNDAAASTKKLSGNLLEVSSSLRAFSTIGSQLCDAHRRNRRTLEHHTQLLELLEIPQLMDTCVRNNLCDEALDLCSFASTLQKRHVAIQRGVERVEGASPSVEKQAVVLGSEEGHGVDIINAIVAEVEATTMVMRRQLLQQLRGRINLPTCLRIISYLKRLDAQVRLRGGRDGSEDSGTISGPRRLRLEFLDCRDAFMASLAHEAAATERSLAPLSSSASRRRAGDVGTPGSVERPYQPLISLVERNRVHLFDIITQYKAIFALGANSLEEILEDDGILSRWLATHVSNFMAALRAQLPLVQDCSTLANVLEQCMYFGMSLARVGADFRASLCPVFERRLCDLMQDVHWKPAAEQVREQLASGPSGWGQPLPVPSTTRGGSQGGGDADTGDLAPPLELLSAPPLAVFTNCLLSSLNDLRHCAPIPSLPKLAALFAECLRALANGLRDFVVSGRSESDPTISARFTELVRLADDVLLPFAARAFAVVFGKDCAAPAAEMLGIEAISQEIRGLATRDTAEESTEVEQPCTAEAKATETVRALTSKVSDENGKR